MSSGSCFCGQAGYKYTKEPAMKALCHCTDCRKISGSVFSTNVVVPEDGFTTTGNLKSIARTADSGKTITSYFCPECGSTLYRDGASFPGLKIIKAGTLDETSSFDEAVKPGAELFVRSRPEWQAAISGAAQKKTSPDGEDA